MNTDRPLLQSPHKRALRAAAFVFAYLIGLLAGLSGLASLAFAGKRCMAFEPEECFRNAQYEAAAFMAVGAAAILLLHWVGRRWLRRNPA